MKCRNCNHDVQKTMNYCPYCSYDLTNQVLEFQKKERKKRVIILILAIIILIVMFVASKDDGKSEYNKATNNKNQLDDMVTSICNGQYDIVYTNNSFDSQGIYQCKDDNYVYYVHDLKETCGFYICGELYELGYTYHESIEEIFPNSIYFYRESRVSTIANELKIAVVANSEEELINNYAEKFYELIKNLNKDYKEDIQLMIYFNSSLSGINTTYDKLFLMAGFNTNNVTQAFGMGTGHGEYTFYGGDPYDLLSAIFADKNNYPTDARSALKNNRNINLTITDGKTITFEEFVERFRNSFNDSF